LLYYSTHADEQTEVSSTGLSGQLDNPTEGTGIGVFLNDALGSKLGYYLTGEVVVSGGECRPDGSRGVMVTVQLNYQPPSSGLPDYVTAGSPGYAYRTHVLVAAPVGGSVDAAEQDSQPLGLRMGTERDRAVGVTVAELKPGAVTTQTFYLTVPPDQPVPTVVHTPGVAAWPVTVDGFATCSQ
jgi:hypothetical protein